MYSSGWLQVSKNAVLHGVIMWREKLGARSNGIRSQLLLRLLLSNLTKDNAGSSGLRFASYSPISLMGSDETKGLPLVNKALKASMLHTAL